MKISRQIHSRCLNNIKGFKNHEIEREIVSENTPGGRKKGVYPNTGLKQCDNGLQFSLFCITRYVIIVGAPNQNYSINKCKTDAELD
jgi:hypothetical protein